MGGSTLLRTVYSLPMHEQSDADFAPSSSNGTARYVLKEIPQDFNLRIEMYRRIGSHPHLRAPTDIIPDRRMFVFDYLDENLLGFAERDLSLSLIKRILKGALQGLAALHEQDLVHCGERTRLGNGRTNNTDQCQDIKANNIMIQPKEDVNGLDIERVHLIDLEDTVHIPPGVAISGGHVGNWMWRSPEAHAMGPVRKPTDMFSFGIVVCTFLPCQIQILLTVQIRA